MSQITQFVVVFALLFAVCAHAYAEEDYDHFKGVKATTFLKTSGPTNINAAQKSKRGGSLNYVTVEQLMGLYNMPYDHNNGAGLTIAVVIAYGASTVEADLMYYSNYFGLPPCNFSNGCLSKVNITGGNVFPADDPTGSWGIEASIDTQVIHTIAPAAKIVIVVCTDSVTPLFRGVKYAANNANYVSLSWGIIENNAQGTLESTYLSGHTGTSIFAAAGDVSNTLQYPASSPSTISVGGTSLYTNSDGSFAGEQGWSSSAGGCSSVWTAPAAQSSSSGYAALNCSGYKAIPDVAMNSDPASGIYVWFSGDCDADDIADNNCWYISGGTSVATPIVAARAALTGSVVDASYVYGSNIVFRDIVQGSSGTESCTVGQDLVTGRGSWIGGYDDFVKESSCEGQITVTQTQVGSWTSGSQTITQWDVTVTLGEYNTYGLTLGASFPAGVSSFSSINNFQHISGNTYTVNQWQWSNSQSAPAGSNVGSGLQYTIAGTSPVTWSVNSAVCTGSCRPTASISLSSSWSSGGIRYQQYVISFTNTGTNPTETVDIDVKFADGSLPTSGGWNLSTDDTAADIAAAGEATYTAVFEDNSFGLVVALATTSAFPAPTVEVVGWVCE